MKGPYRAEIIENATKIYPCRFCEEKLWCKKDCKGKRSYMNLYSKAGKNNVMIFVINYQTCQDRSHVLEGLDTLQNNIINIMAN